MIEKIAVVGDAMSDIDIHLELVKTIDGMPVYRESKRHTRPGGAANVALMCRTLNADVRLLSCGYSYKTRHYLDETIFRIDRDIDLSPTTDCRLKWKGELIAFDPDIILVCDHAKGVVTSEVMEMLKSLGKPIYVDPCVTSDWYLFLGVGCISANLNEWKSAPAMSASVLIERMGSGGVIWDGVDGSGSMESICDNPIDPVGAGDQFLSVLACMRATGTDWNASIRKANIAAGLQCERRGIVPVTWDEIDAFSKTPQETA